MGTVTRVGDNASGNFKVNDRVAVGPNVDCCGDCEHCSEGEESYCDERVDTYLGKHRATGVPTQGGFAERMVVDQRFVFHVPDNLPSYTAAPLMCAGLTVFQPLQRHFCDGASVGIVGVGGLGHFALQFARALGYKRVIAFSHTEDKDDIAKQLGAHEVVCTKATRTLLTS